MTRQKSSTRVVFTVNAHRIMKTCEWLRLDYYIMGSSCCAQRRKSVLGMFCFLWGGGFFRTVKAHQEYVGLLLSVEALRGFVEDLRSAESADTEEACFRLM